MNRTPVALLFAAVLGGCSPALAQSGAVARVNGVEIPAAHAEFMIRQQSARAGGDTERLRNAVRDDLVNRQVVVQEAERSGFLKRPEVQIELELLRQASIVQIYLRDWLTKNAVPEDEVRAAYENARKAAGDKEYHARHIVTGSEAEAKELIAKLNSGADFAEAAKESRDVGSRERGGDLGWLQPNALVKPLTDALSVIGKGTIAPAPVRTRAGYHVLRLDDVRPIQFPSFEQAGRSLRQQLTQRKIEQLVRTMRDAAKIE